MYHIIRRKLKIFYGRYPFVFFGVIILFLAFLGYSFIPRTSIRWAESPVLEEKKPTEFRSQLDGTVVPEGEQQPEIVTVMIDNLSAALPQVGVKEAPVVYEAPVEGGVTRFMAVFPRSSTIQKVGPVRSARPYFLDWLREYGDAMYIHCGGSPEALSKIKSENIFDANEFYNGGYFWRDNARYAPHNLFIKSINWQKLWTDKGPEKSKSWQGWVFDSTAPTGTEIADIKEINIQYSPGYSVGWKYDPTANVFGRERGGKPFSDTSGQILADNILIQFASVEILDEVGRRAIDTVAVGEARVLRDGKIIKGTWKKEGIYDRTRFYDLAGQEIKIKPGRTWVQVVPLGTALDITN